MVEADLLYGVKEIARYLGRTPKQVSHWIGKDLIPTFKLGGMVCSTKKGLADYFEGKMSPDHQIGANPGISKMDIDPLGD